MSATLDSLECAGQQISETDKPEERSPRSRKLTTEAFLILCGLGGTFSVVLSRTIKLLQVYLLDSQPPVKLKT